MLTFLFYAAIIGGVLFYKLTTGQQRTAWAWDFWTFLLLAAAAGTVYEFFQ